jgi:hypothetical protein
MPVASCAARMFAPNRPIMALMALDPQVTRSSTLTAFFSALVARTAWTPVRPSWTVPSVPEMVRTLVDRFRWNLAPVVSWNF